MFANLFILFVFFFGFIIGIVFSFLLFRHVKSHTFDDTEQKYYVVEIIGHEIWLQLER